MFLGEFLCLIPYAIAVWYKRNRRKQYSERQQALSTTDLTEPFLSEPVEQHPQQDHLETADQTVKKIFAFAIPTLCDALTTTLMNVGLYYTSASVYQMLRGSLVFFAGARVHRMYAHNCNGL